MNLERLYELGFDRSSRNALGLFARCSQCSTLNINGVPTHETGCPNTKRKCRGCNTLVSAGVTYCEDCR